jgi:hypothetical protein
MGNVNWSIQVVFDHISIAPESYFWIAVTRARNSVNTTVRHIEDIWSQEVIKSSVLGLHLDVNEVVRPSKVLNSCHDIKKQLTTIP